MTLLTMQDALARLDKYWIAQGCMTVQPMNTEVGAGTLNPATFLRVLGPEPWRVAYVEPSVRPDDSRYGENPNRIQCHTQYQVVIKPEPGNAQDLYLESLIALGIDVHAHDIRFVEDNWASPALGAWGLGWEVWLDGLEITQFTYFQQAGGVSLKPTSVEITYGVERIMMALQGVRHFKDIIYAPGVTYGEVFGQAEYEMSRYALDDADVDATRLMLDTYAVEAQRMITLRLPIPAYSFVLKCSHAFNVLDARGAISTSERTMEFARIRKMAASVAGLWIERREELGHPLGISPDAIPIGKSTVVYTEKPLGSRRMVLEVGTEELPPSEVRSATLQLHALVVDALAATRLTHGAVHVHATPRRLIVIIDEVAAREDDYERVIRGPRFAGAFSADGSPTKAATGFARAAGVDISGLEDIEVEGVKYLALVRSEEGRDVLSALSDVLAGTVTGLRSSRNMRWDDPLLSFARPIRWITAIWGDEVVPFTVGALTSDRVTRGLRTNSEIEISLGSAEEFVERLCAAGVVLDSALRRTAIVEGAIELAARVGGTVDVEGQSELIDQITHLVEAPTAILGEFDIGYLDMPDAILITVMRNHQRYLPIYDQHGVLLPYFVVIANGAVNEELVRSGNEGVLRARFEDAAFFYRLDSAIPPEAMRARLSNLTFADKLGSMRDRAERIGVLATRLADVVGLGGSDRVVLDRARSLVKFDLGSKVVSELTSLVGFMAREYAMADGESEEVAQALLEVELPRHAGDVMPRTAAGAILSIADRLDFLCGLAATVGVPTGSSDQYALRRAALGAQAVHRISKTLWSLSLLDALRLAAMEQPVEIPDSIITELIEFLRRRLEQSLTEEGVPAEHIQAAIMHADRPARVYSILSELQGLAETVEFRSLAETMQRTRRIVSIESAFEYDARALREPAELHLHAVLTQTTAAVKGVTDLAEFTRLTTDLTAAVGVFFEEVFVMVEEPNLHTARIGLLTAVFKLGEPMLSWDQLRF